MLLFFQAEDGMRDLVQSRGLEEVYKKQGWYFLSMGVPNECYYSYVSHQSPNTGCYQMDSLSSWILSTLLCGFRHLGLVCNVTFASYTHLTLPTIFRVFVLRCVYLSTVLLY